MYIEEYVNRGLTVFITLHCIYSMYYMHGFIFINFNFLCESRSLELGQAQK